MCHVVWSAILTHGYFVFHLVSGLSHCIGLLCDFLHDDHLCWLCPRPSLGVVCLFIDFPQQGCVLLECLLILLSTECFVGDHRFVHWLALFMKYPVCLHYSFLLIIFSTGVYLVYDGRMLVVGVCWGVGTKVLFGCLFGWFFFLFLSLCEIVSIFLSLVFMGSYPSAQYVMISQFHFPNGIDL